MALRELDRDWDENRALPAAAEAFVVEAQRRIDRFLESSDAAAVPAFVPSDARSFWRGMAWLAELKLCPGRNLCEWGSGFGVVAGLGTMLGFRAYGIESHGPLVKEARQLAKDFGLEVEFVRGTFLPAGAEEFTPAAEEFAWLDPSGDDGHDLLAMEPDEFDLIAAYPWPGEEATIDGLFERYAARGAILATYHGRDGLRLRRKTR